MGTSDGTVIGTTKIAGFGPASDRYNVVLLSDGYRPSEMAQYATDAQNFVNSLFATPPYNDPMLFGTKLSDAMNIWRVDVSSTDSGADDPVACGGTGATAATYFDAKFCNSGIQRLLLINNATAFAVAGAQVPQWHMILALVNTPIYGGGGGDVATFSMAPNAFQIGIHEMGHTAFGLADEYEYWAGCGVDTNRNNHPAVEPGQPNVTINSNRATIKWGDLIAASTPMPTTSNANCSQCDSQLNPVGANTVGAFEGAHYYHCDAYRPQFNCKMRALNWDFCAVCRRVIRNKLSPFLPSPRLPDLFDLLDYLRQKFKGDWVSDPVPWDIFRLMDALQGGKPGGIEAPDELSNLIGTIDQMDTGELRATLLRLKAGIARLETAARLVEGKIGSKGF
jgi:hypothetical protein